MTKNKLPLSVKHFSHSDMDGLGCIVMGKHMFLDTDAEICEYSNVDEKIMEYVTNEDKLNLSDVLLITDIGIKQEVAEMIDNRLNDPNSNLNRVIFLDHHENTGAWINKYPWALCQFRSVLGKNSGTSMLFTWFISEFYNSEKNYFSTRTIPNELPTFAEIVRKYDTWEWYQNDLSTSVPFTLQTLLESRGTEWFLQTFAEDINIDNTISGKNKDEVTHLIKNVVNYIDALKKDIQYRSIGGHVFGVVFAEKNISILGSQLHDYVLDTMHTQDVVGIIIINMNRKTLSLRSRRDDVNMGQISRELFNGGGHPQAAGAQLDDETISKIMVTALNATPVKL